MNLPSLSLPKIIPSSSKLGKRLADYKLRRRRAKQAKKKGGGKKLTFFLLFLVTVLITTFFGAQRFLSPSRSGQEISPAELQALAEEGRISQATFLDEDSHLVGSFTAPVPVEEPAPDADDNDSKSKKTEAKAEGAKADADATTDDPKADADATTKDPKADADATTDDPKADGTDSETAGGAVSKKGDKTDPKGSNGDTTEEEAATEPPPVPAPAGSGDFWLTYPKTGVAFGILQRSLSDGGVNYVIDSQTEKVVVRAISTYLLPLLILATVFGLMFATGKGSGSAIGQIMSFGSMGKKKYKKGSGHKPVTFDDVGSAEVAITELKEVVDYLKNPERYDEIGAVPPKGVLLFGPPGCGKTLLAKAVAGEAGVPFFSVAGAEFVESLVGVGAARVRDLFARVRAVSPAIVFIDELDAAGRRRGAGGGEGGSDEREQTLNQILVEMDGFEVSAGMVVIGATNRPDILDPALLRPGRFDRHITVEQPGHQGRMEILQLHARGKPMAASVDYDYVAKRTPGFSGADLAGVINEAALLSLREAKPEIEMDEMVEAIQRVLHGPKKRGTVLSEEEERRAALHETGHAIVAASVGRAEDIHRVSILARGRGVGLTGIQTAEVAILQTTLQLYSKLVVEMGGLAAEEIVLGDVSTGAEQDLEQATDIARDMICRYGMSPALGRLRLMASDVDTFLGVDAGFSKLSTETHVLLDKESRRLLDQAEYEAIRILRENEELLLSMANTLKEHETLEGQELQEILTGVVPQEVSRFMPFPAPERTEGNGNGGSKAAIKPRTGLEKL